LAETLAGFYAGFQNFVTKRPSVQFAGLTLMSEDQFRLAESVSEKCIERWTGSGKSSGSDQGHSFALAEPTPCLPCGMKQALVFLDVGRDAERTTGPHGIVFGFQA